MTHREDSHKRIVDVAARQFRAGGIEPVRVADIMAEAGLTVGGFYKHFASKDALLHDAIGCALEQISTQLRELTAGKPRPEALEIVISLYLSEEHVRRPDLGCALAALGTEMARLPKAMRREVNRALNKYAESLSYLMPGADAAERKAQFQILFSSMAGCIMTVRAMTDVKQRKQILRNSCQFFIAAFCATNSNLREPSNE